MKNKNAKIIKDIVDLVVTSDEVLEDVQLLDTFLTSTDKDIRNVKYKHHSLFINLLKRFIGTYKYWHLRKKFILKDGYLYFKFSNNTMYKETFLSTEEMRTITKDQITFLITHNVIKKAYFEISEGRKSIFYAVNFKRLYNYFMDFHISLREDPNIDIKKLKRKLKNESTSK